MGVKFENLHGRFFDRTTFITRGVTDMKSAIKKLEYENVFKTREFDNPGVDLEKSKERRSVKLKRIKDEQNGKASTPKQ